MDADPYEITKNSEGLHQIKTKNGREASKPIVGVKLQFSNFFTISSGGRTIELGTDSGVKVKVK